MKNFNRTISTSPKSLGKESETDKGQVAAMVKQDLSFVEEPDFELEPDS